MIRIALCGSCGRMGREIIKQIVKQKDMKLVAAIEASGAKTIGKDAGEIAGVGKLDVEVVGADSLRETLKRATPDVLIDFTRADAAVENIKVAAELKIPVVVGTTGFTAEQHEEMKKQVVKNKIPALISPNMSVGVNVFFKLAQEAARMLGQEYEVEIVETHHRGKLDSPSGTALRTANLIAKEFGLREGDVEFGRPAGKHGERGKKIYVHSLRLGDVAGEHTVTFAGPSERLELVHRAHSRETFAAGVIKAARFVVEKGEPGKIHDMWDALGLRSNVSRRR